MAEPLRRIIPSRPTEATNITSLMNRIHINSHFDGTSAMLIDGAEEQRQQHHVRAVERGSTVISTQIEASPIPQRPYLTEVEQAEEKGEKESRKRDLREYNLDGLNCPICIEPWTLQGDHQVSCLPCGHIYGLSCINTWIQHRKRFAKCPQCNAKINPKEVTKLYASPTILVNPNEPKKDELAEAECLKTERSNLLLIQESLLKELRLLKKQVSNGNAHFEGTRRNSYESVTGELLQKKQNGIRNGGKIGRCQSNHCNFVLEHEISVESARLFDMDASYKALLLARRVPGMGGRHILNKINLMNPVGYEEILLPASTKAVKDLHISPCGRLALLASLGKKLSIISMGGNSIILSYSLPCPAWSCSWDSNSPHSMYTGLQNGMLLEFDMRHTIHPVQSMHGLNSRPIHTIHPLEHSTVPCQGARQLLTASLTGPCFWNVTGGMERTFTVPELESEGSCISLAYSPSSEDIIAAYRPKTQISNLTGNLYTLPVSHSLLNEVAPSSLLYVKRVASSFYFKLNSASAQLGDVKTVKSTVINVENCRPVYAYGNDVANGLRLLEFPDLAVTQNLKAHQHPILDVKYSQSQGSGVLGCISENKLQLFSAKIL